MSESIRVIVRIRPLNSLQLGKGCRSVVQVDEQNGQINLTKPQQPDNIKSFAYDAVFSEASQQAHLYGKSAYQLVEHVLEGYNGTVFAYGQTGCGKTHSMVGLPDNSELQGIIPRTFGHVLKKISETADKQYLLRCSFLQIYNQEIHDLLGEGKGKLQLKQSPEKGVFVKELSLRQAKSHQQLMELLQTGTKKRAVGETAMNKDSSRSHLLFALHLESASAQGQLRKYTASRLNLVDLAGSERLSKTGAAGDRMKEAQKINLSLSALGNVISALVEGRSQHIPYRDSKLTRLLQDSLGGNTKTVMLANCSPADYNYEQTLSTLRYASRAKMIKNKPVINEDPKDALLKQYAHQIEQLKGQVRNNGGDNPDLSHRLKEKEVQLENEKNQKADLLKRIRQLQCKHIQGKSVNVDPVILQSLRKVSILATRPQTLKGAKCSIQPASQEIEQLTKFLNTSKLQKQQKQVIKKMKQKIKQLERQISDVAHQNFMDKQWLLQDIRCLTKQSKFLNSVLAMLVQNHQLQQIRQASIYSEQREEYKVPPFYLKNKELVFPKLQQQQSLDLIKQMHDRRQISIPHDKENCSRVKETAKEAKEHKKRKSREYDVHDVLREAREEFPPTLGLQSKKVNKVRLEPLSKT